MIGAGMVKPGATVIDVGINRTEEGLSGDVDFEAVREVAGAITPVPGGVGPMTIAMLLSNTLARGEPAGGVGSLTARAARAYTLTRALAGSQTRGRDGRQTVRRGEMIAGVSRSALFIIMFFSWFGLSGERRERRWRSSSKRRRVAGRRHDFNAWQSFDFIDIVLFVAVVVASAWPCWRRPVERASARRGQRDHGTGSGYSGRSWSSTGSSTRR